MIKIIILSQIRADRHKKLIFEILICPTLENCAVSIRINSKCRGTSYHCVFIEYFRVLEYAGTRKSAAKK